MAWEKKHLAMTFIGVSPRQSGEMQSKDDNVFNNKISAGNMGKDISCMK